MTLTGSQFIRRLEHHGFNFFSGVPCSLLSDVFAVLESHPRLLYVEAVREDDAVGHAAGAWLAGRKPVVLMQNSGLGNSLNAIASLSQIYRLPFLLIATWRGYQGKDAPEHRILGPAMTDLLDRIGLPWQVYEPSELDLQLDRVETDLAKGSPSVLIVRKGYLDQERGAGG